MSSSSCSRGNASLRYAVAIAAACAFLMFAPAADAAITNVFSNTPTPIPCVTQGSGVRLCDQTTFAPAQPRSTVKTFDGVPIDVRVAFPPEPASGPDGPYPMIMLFHGYGGSKLSLASMQPFLDRGYATFSMTTRGFGQSCGNTASRNADPAGCQNGYVRLMDTRYEVRDAQEFAGLLADEGRTSYNKIGAIGGSYGGGLSMSLAALKDRKMLPNGSLVPWQSPGGTPMRIAAATPEIPWTDLAYSLVAERRHARLRRRRTLPGPHRRAEAVARGRPVRDRAGGGLLRAGGHRSRCRPHQLEHGVQQRRAVRRPVRQPEPDARRHPRRGHHASLLLLHRPFPATGPDPDLERIRRTTCSRSTRRCATTTARAPSTPVRRSRCGR